MGAGGSFAEAYAKQSRMKRERSFLRIMKQYIIFVANAQYNIAFEGVLRC